MAATNGDSTMEDVTNGVPEGIILPPQNVRTTIEALETKGFTMWSSLMTFLGGPR